MTQINRYTIFLDWKNQYCGNDYNTQSNYRFSVIPINYQRHFFTELEQIFYMFYGNTQKTQIEKAILKQNGAGGIRVPGFRLYYKATIVKTVCIDQWNRTEHPKINPCTYGHLIMTNEGRIYNGEKRVSSMSSAGKTGQLHIKE